MERRDFVKILGGAGIAGLAAGCGPTAAKLAWNQEFSYRPKQSEVLASSPKVRSQKYSQTRQVIAGIPGPCTVEISAISRDTWNARALIAGRARGMGGVRRITIHHEGGPHPNHDRTLASVASTMRRIQAEHRRRLRAADIGYHFVVDRSGRIWQGREEKYQGAHVSKKNSQNIGVMILGNFDIQSPTRAQVSTLGQLAQWLLHGYSIPASEMYCHGELANTRCPGKFLKPHIVDIRKQLLRMSA